MSRVMDGRRGFPAVVVAGAVVLEAAPLLRSVAEEKVKDPAGESAPLPDTVADLPDDSVAVVDPVADWTRVPGSPLEVRVDPDATAEDLNPVPAATGGEVRVVPAVASVGAEDPLALVDVAPVRVEVKRPDDLGASVMLVSLTDGSAAGELVTDRKAPPVEVRLDYGGFDELFGGSWGQRLQVLAYPVSSGRSEFDNLLYDWTRAIRLGSSRTV